MSYVSTHAGKKSARTQRAHARQALASAAANQLEMLEGRTLLSTVSISSPTVNEGGNLVYTVSLNQASNKAVTVNYAVSGGTAKAGQDYTAKKPGKLTFAAGQTSKNITVKTRDNNIASADKTVLMRLSGVNSGNKIQGSGVGTGTIVNTDAAPVIKVNNVRVTEGDTGTKILTFKVKMTGSSETPVKINYQTVDVTATSKGNKADYNAAKGTLTFTKKGTQQVRVVIRNDNTAEANEAFLLRLTAAKGTTVTLPALGYAVGAIANDDGGNVASGVKVSTEPQSFQVAPGTTAGVVIRLDKVSADPVTVNYTTANGSATAGDDFTPTSGQVTFAVGETEKTILIPITASADSGETFTVAVSDPTGGAAVGTGSSTIAITNTAVPALSVSNATVTEGDSGTKTVTFTVSLSSAPVAGQVISATYTFSGVSATAGTDFLATNGTVTFTAGQTSKTVTATVIGDTVDEADETFTLTLGAPVNAPITTAVGTATIIDDDGGLSTNPNDGQGLSFAQGAGNTSWDFNPITGIRNSLHFKYAIASTRATPVHNGVIQIFLANQGANLDNVTPYKTVAIGTIPAGATIRGDIDATGGPAPVAGQQYYARLVADNGVVYAVDNGPSFNVNLNTPN